MDAVPVIDAIDSLCFAKPISLGLLVLPTPWGGTCGCTGYLPHPVQPSFFSPGYAPLDGSGRQPNGMPMGMEDLTRRELEVLELLRLGHTNTELARNLHVSTETVKEHLHNLLRKLAIKNRTQAAVLAEREACALIAATYSEEAAAAIRNQPRPSSRH